tara:strand:+ start:20 stop:661 length:642 start_codon:yes stop_codon:yes gene_type:complete
MLFTQTYLSNQIKNIKCAYATYMSKYSKALAYGLATEKCLYNNMVVLKWYIKLLERFNSQGVLCTGTPPCQLANNTFTTETICITNDEGFDECTIPSRAPDDFPIDVIYTWQFTDTLVTVNGGTPSEFTTTYTYIDGILTIGVTSFAVVFNDDCSATAFSITKDEVPITINVVMVATDNAEYTCDWSSECVTPLEVQEIIKHSYTLLGRNCNC